MGTGLEIGQTGLRAAQQAMITAGNNIANANTPGFSRRTPILTAEVPVIDPSGFTIGQGVRLVEIRRETVEFLDIRLYEKQSALTNAETKNIRLSDLEGLFNELSDFSLKNAITDFFDATNEVSKVPDSSSARAQMVEKAKILTQTFNQMGKDIDDMRTRSRDDIKTTVKQINNITAKLADLNAKISSLSLSGVPPSELEDQRDVLLTDLSKLIDTNVKTSGDGITKIVSFGGRNLVGGANFLLLSTQTNGTTGDVSVIFTSDSVTATPLSGGLKGLLDFQTDANTFKSELDKLAKSMADEFNRVHSEGVNLNGSFNAAITSKNGVSNAASALNTSGLLPFTPSSGDIFVTVTNTSTGAVTKTKVTADVATDTLTSLATKLSAVSNITATVTTSGGNNFLTITPSSGFTFDFSSSLDPNPDLTSFPGASVTMGGAYTGSDNDTYTFTVLGSGGIVGATSGLQIQVRDAGGAVLQTLDVGDTYVPGTTIDVVDGLKMTLSGGALTTGNNFSTSVLNNPDTTNLLSALGINRFFSGNSANTIAVESDIQNNVSLIAAASSNSKGDNANAIRMVDLQFKKVSDTNTLSGRTFGEFLAETAAQVGSESNLSKVTLDSQQATFEALKSLKEQSVGVSIDEELATLLKFEQMYNASARFISSVNQAIDRILQL